MTTPDRSGGTRTQRERKALELLNDVHAADNEASRIAIAMAALGEEYRRGFAESWEECQAEAAPEPVKRGKRNVVIVKNPKDE